MTSLKHENSATNKNGIDPTIVGVVAIIAMVVVIFVFTIITIANPFEIRKEKIDMAKINDFEQIKYEIQNYYDKHKALPDNFDVEDFVLEPTLKESMKMYGYNYEVVEINKFKLCTTFLTDTRNETDEKNDYYYSGSAKHKKGYDCVFYEVFPTQNDYPYIELAPESR